MDDEALEPNDDDLEHVRSVQTDHAVIASVPLSFVIRGRLSFGAEAPAEPFDREHPPTWEEEVRAHARRELARVDAVEASLARDLPGIRAQAFARFDFGDTAGPGIGDPSILALLVTDDPIGRIADLVTLAVAARALVDWVKAKGGRVSSIDDGIAVVYAAEGVQRETGDDDLTLLFAEQVIPRGAEPWDMRGYRVAFGDDELIHEVVVTRHGEVRPVVTLRPDQFKRRHRDALLPVAQGVWDVDDIPADAEPYYADDSAALGDTTPVSAFKPAKKQKRRGKARAKTKG